MLIVIKLLVLDFGHLSIDDLVKVISFQLQLNLIFLMFFVFSSFVLLCFKVFVRCLSYCVRMNVFLFFSL